MTIEYSFNYVYEPKEDETDSIQCPRCRKLYSHPRTVVIPATCTNPKCKAQRVQPHCPHCDYGPFTYEIHNHANSVSGGET